MGVFNNVDDIDPPKGQVETEMGNGVRSIGKGERCSIGTMRSLLRTGTGAQRTVILYEIQRLLKQCFEDNITIWVPMVCAELVNWTIDLLLCAADVFSQVIQKSIPEKIAKTMCIAALDVVTWHKTEEIFEAWGEILVICLPIASWEEDNDICSVIAILDDFTFSNEIICRKMVARLLGSLPSCLKTGEVESFVLNRALHLADDDDVDVRGMVSESLASIGAVVDISIVESCIWPTLLTLLTDDDARIHAATLRTISQILVAHEDEIHTSIIFKTLLPPVFAAECQFAEKSAQADQRKVDDDTYLLLEIFSDVFGQLLQSTYHYLKSEVEKKNCFLAFLAMSTCNGPVVRRYCAFNLPGVAKCLSGLFSVELSAITEYLSRDPDSESKWNLAAGIHETVRQLMGKKSASNIFKAVVSLLKDDNPLVRENVLEHLHELIVSLTRDPDLNLNKKIVNVFQNLNLLAKGGWRTQELLAKELEKTTELVPPHCLFSDVLPLLCRMADDNTYQVRKAAMSAIAKTMWYLPYPEEREDAMNTFSKEWGGGSVFWMRIAFIDCAYSASKVFSKDLFNTLFTERLFTLAFDKVPNVRLRIASILHEMAPLFHTHPGFEAIVENLSRDNDKDVREKMEGIEERMQNAVGDMSAFQKKNKLREAAELVIQSRGENFKSETRRRGGRLKGGRNILLPIIGGKGGLRLSPNRNLEETTTPTSVIVSNSRGENSKAKKSSEIDGNSSEVGEGTEVEETPQQMPQASTSPRKSLKGLLGLKMEGSIPTSTPERGSARTLKSHPLEEINEKSEGRGDGPANGNGARQAAPRSPPTRSLKDLLGLNVENPGSDIRTSSKEQKKARNGGQEESEGDETENGNRVDACEAAEQKGEPIVEQRRSLKSLFGIGPADGGPRRRSQHANNSHRHGSDSPSGRKSLRAVFSAITFAMKIRG